MDCDKISESRTRRDPKSILFRYQFFKKKYELHKIA